MTESSIRRIEGTAIHFGKKNYAMRSWVYALVSLFLIVRGLCVYSESLWIYAFAGFFAAAASVKAGRLGAKSSGYTAEKAGMVLAVLAVMEFVSNWVL